MRKISVYLLAILLGISIPVYFLLIWEPLKSEEALSENVSDVSINNSSEESKENQVINNKEEKLLLKLNNNSNSFLENLEGNRKDSINVILKKLSVSDLIKVNNYFVDKDNKENVKLGIELIRRRLSYSDYEVFKNIIENKVDSTIIQ